MIHICYGRSSFEHHVEDNVFNLCCDANILLTALKRALPFLKAELAIADERFEKAEPERMYVERLNKERHDEYARTNDAKYYERKYAGLAAGKERLRIMKEIESVDNFIMQLTTEAER